jgi:hypothetical protein
MIVSYFPARLVFFLSALGLYAVLGSPTPDNPGWVELVLGILLVLAVGVSAAFYRVSHALATGAYQRFLSVLFLYGFAGLTVVGSLQGQDADIALRDVSAFLLVCLPVFLSRSFENDESAYKGLIAAIIIVGLVFSLRALLPFYGVLSAPDELLYLANSPLVLFTALFLLSDIFEEIGQKRISLFTVIKGALLVVPLAAMLIDVQRAPITAIALTFIIMSVRLFFHNYRRGLIFVALIAFGIYYIWPVFDLVVQEIVVKTAQVGANMREEELRAVWAAIEGSWMSVLFGTGWGGVFNAPTVGGLSVSYTHSFLTYMLLKGGLVGLSLTLLFTGSVLVALWHTARQDFSRFMVMIWPFLIPLLLYASHKSLDYGLILLFIFVSAERLKALRVAPEAVKIPAMRKRKYKRV